MMSSVYQFLLLVGILTGMDQKPEFLISLTRNAEKYNQSFPSEHLYIETDRAYYRPGDELWFKAYARNTLSNQELSNDLNIKLVDVFGKQVLYLRYPLYQNTSNGYLVLPALLEEGKYYLIGYTGWMKNMPVSDAFTKEIIVSNHIERTIDISVEFSRKLYYPGDQVEGRIFARMLDGSALKRTKYSFICRSANRNIFSGWGEIGESGSDQFTGELPDNIDSDLLWIEFKVRQKRMLETYVLPFPIAKKSVKLDVFPEGGTLIAGIENSVAFKAADEHGLPVDIEGYLLDESGRQLNKIKSTFNGMGRFDFIPEPGQYRIRLVSPLLANPYFSFPEVRENGIRLSYSGLSNGEIIFSLRNSDQEKTEKVFIIVEQRSKILWAESTSFRSEEIVKVPLKRFESGIAKCTVMDETGNLIAARNVFLEGENFIQKLDFSASKNYYGLRERVALELSNFGSEELLANISVFSDKYFNRSDIPMKQYFHFATELKEINSNIINAELSVNDIDLIVMTHEAKSLPITRLIANKAKDPVPFYNNDGIRGHILDKKGNPVQNAKVKIIHSLDLHTYQASSDSLGLFHITFDNNIINYNYLTIAVAVENGRSGSILRLFDHYSDNILENLVVERDQWKYNQTTDLIKYGNPLLLYSGRYGQGKIQVKKGTKRKGYDYERFASFDSALNIIKEIKDYRIVNGEIIFKSRGGIPENMSGAIIVLDGIAFGSNTDILNRISPKEIRNISISTWPSDIQQYTDRSSSGIIKISTISGRQDRSQTYTHEFQQDLLMIDHHLNSPDYASGDHPQSDNRITLFWKPDILLEKSGSCKFTFYTSDLTGTFICICQGTDQKGHFFSKKFDITVR
jgi:hypothetical protein